MEISQDKQKKLLFIWPAMKLSQL